MPQRPSKKPRVPTSANAGKVQRPAGADQLSQQHHQDKTAKAILGKFQGRKSV